MSETSTLKYEVIGVGQTETGSKSKALVEISALGRREGVEEALKMRRDGLGQLLLSITTLKELAECELVLRELGIEKGCEALKGKYTEGRINEALAEIV